MATSSTAGRKVRTSMPQILHDIAANILADVWDNKFLFVAVVAGFVLIFPLLYIPVINDVVFKHIGLTWEWGIVFIAALLFFLGAETYKYGKRAYFRRQAGKSSSDDPSLNVEERVFQRYLTGNSTGSQEKAEEKV